MKGIKGTDNRLRMMPRHCGADWQRMLNKQILGARAAHDLANDLYWYERDACWPRLDWGYIVWTGEYNAISHRRYVTPVAGHIDDLDMINTIIPMPYCRYVVTPPRVVTRDRGTYPRDTRRLSDWSVVSPAIHWPY